MKNKVFIFIILISLFFVCSCKKSEVRSTSQEIDTDRVTQGQGTTPNIPSIEPSNTWRGYRYFKEELSLSSACSASVKGLILDETSFTEQVEEDINKDSVKGNLLYSRDEEHYVSNNSSTIKKFREMVDVNYKVLLTDSPAFMKALQSIHKEISISLFLDDYTNTFNFVFLSSGEIIIIDELVCVSSVNYDADGLNELIEEIKRDNNNIQSVKLIDLDEIIVDHNDLHNIRGYDSLDFHDYSNDEAEYIFNYRVTFHLDPDALRNNFRGEVLIPETSMYFDNSREFQDYLIHELGIDSYSNLTNDWDVSFDIGALTAESETFILKLLKIKYITNMSISDNHYVSIISTDHNFYVGRGSVYATCIVIDSYELFKEKFVLHDFNISGSSTKTDVKTSLEKYNEEFFEDHFLYIYSEKMKEMESKDVYVCVSQDKEVINYKKFLLGPKTSENSYDYVFILELNKEDVDLNNLVVNDRRINEKVHLKLHVFDDLYELDVFKGSKIDLAFINHNVVSIGLSQFVFLSDDISLLNPQNEIVVEEDKELWCISFNVDEINGYGYCYFICMNDYHYNFKIQMEYDRTMVNVEYLRAVSGLNIDTLYTYNHIKLSQDYRFRSPYYFYFTLKEEGLNVNRVDVGKEGKVSEISINGKIDNKAYIDGDNLYFNIYRTGYENTKEVKYYLKEIIYQDDSAYCILKREYNENAIAHPLLKYCYYYEEIEVEEVSSLFANVDKNNIKVIVDDEMIKDDVLNGEYQKPYEYDAYNINLVYNNDLFFYDVSDDYDEIKSQIAYDQVFMDDVINKIQRVDYNNTNMDILESYFGEGFNFDIYRIYVIERYTRLKEEKASGYYLNLFYNDFEILGRRVDLSQTDYEEGYTRFVEMVAVDIFSISRYDKDLKPRFAFASNYEAASTITFTNNGEKYGVNSFSKSFTDIDNVEEVIPLKEQYNLMFYKLVPHLINGSMLLSYYSSDISFLVKRISNDSSEINATYTFAYYDSSKHIVYLDRTYNRDKGTKDDNCKQICYDLVKISETFTYEAYNTPEDLQVIIRDIN